ncbi:hypothetical protein I6A60_12960 [Frankia sp. AgB1.9]|uniref:hypothetical protein n=1 Tax=unclassified Frankia TaxID=2632575 RepID=UPI001934579C|nr:MULTISPECIES: hypothetical protein [unclassified Frankia]MBL7490982.1 hypothetical protein [Frankia sp. AgW1.1]MBL7548778.1 hypothetical protein [Frankia sp. AgB1.9]MBL7623889.1 hypothetical protein [Frankia sp. AgB1.8]
MRLLLRAMRRDTLRFRLAARDIQAEIGDVLAGTSLPRPGHLGREPGPEPTDARLAPTPALADTAASGKS